jgi:hypothetical protein
LCFINDIFNCTKLNLLLFADDSNALAKHDNLSDLIDFVNLELQKLSTWCKANKLAINTDKTKYMIFRTKNRIVNLNGKEIYMNFNELGAAERPELKVKLIRVHNNGDKCNQTYKMLGVLFDEFLSFSQHLAYMQTKIAKSLFILNRSKNFISKNARKLLFYAMVHSHLTYCPIIYGTASKTHIKKLSILQKKAIRILNCSDYNAHTAEMFIQDEILPVEYIIQQSKLLFMHSVKYGYCPKSYLDVFPRNELGNAAYELRNFVDFNVPRPRIELFKRMPLYSLPDEWNRAGDLQYYQNPATFKIVLKATLLHKFAEANGIGGALIF